MHAVRRFLRSESAIAVTEYGLLVALVAVLLAPEGANEPRVSAVQ